MILSKKKQIRKMVRWIGKRTKPRGGQRTYNMLHELNDYNKVNNAIMELRSKSDRRGVIVAFSISKGLEDQDHESNLLPIQYFRSKNTKSKKKINKCSPGRITSTANPDSF